MQRKHYIKTVSIYLKQKTCISSFVFHLIYVSLYLAGKNCFLALDNLIWLWCCLALEYYSVALVKVKISKTSPKTLLSGQSINEFLEHSSQTECVRAGGEWIILDYLSSTWEAYYKTATAEINLLEFPGNLQRLFCGEIETPFARSLPVKGILNHRKPRHKNSVKVPHRSKQSW